MFISKTSPLDKKVKYFSRLSNCNKNVFLKFISSQQHGIFQKEKYLTFLSYDPNFSYNPSLIYALCLRLVTGQFFFRMSLCLLWPLLIAGDHLFLECQDVIALTRPV